MTVRLLGVAVGRQLDLGLRVPVGDVPGTSGCGWSGGNALTEIRPYPKDPPRKKAARKRRQRVREILTDTPVKKMMEEKEMEKARKTAKKPRSASKRCQKKTGQASQNKRIDGAGADVQLTGDSETHCFVCSMMFSMSAEEWVCCTSCGT